MYYGNSKTKTVLGMKINALVKLFNAKNDVILDDVDEKSVELYKEDVHSAYSFSFPVSRSAHTWGFK